MWWHRRRLVAAGEKGEVNQMGNGGRFITDVFSFRDSLRPQVDLNGAWEFRRDPQDEGCQQGWHEGQGEFAQTITIPGAPQAQGIGEPNQLLKTFFHEPFWVRRRFALPKFGANQRVWLRLGGIFPAADLYVNGAHVGYTQSSRTQQRVDVTDLVRAGRGNLAAIKVTAIPKFPEIRLDGMYEWEELGVYWTGVYRPVACEITDRVSVVDAYVQPQLAADSVRVDLTLSEAASEPLNLMLRVVDGKRTVGETTMPLAAGEAQAQAEVKLGDYVTWAPEHPQLYVLDISVTSGGGDRCIDRVAIRFGMRQLTVQGAKFYLNGKPLLLRVFGDIPFYPETLCPADKEWHLSRLKRAREYGLNGAKGCMEPLAMEFIEAADETGVMIIQEMPFGLSQDYRNNRYKIDERFRAYYAQELEGLIKGTRNHASVMMYSMSSELEFANQTQESFDFYSRELPRRTRALAPHALVIDCTGYVNSEDTEKGKRDTDFYASVHPKWMKEVLDETDMITDLRHPAILHEYNWWSCYPDPADRGKYAATQLKPFWLDMLERTARENGQEDSLATYRQHSLWLQALCRKDGIEYARRNPTVEGYILWLLIDYGRYAEGLLDDFWQPKNVSAQEFLKSNGDTVVLLAQEGNRCRQMGEKQRIPLAISHYGETPLNGSTLRWKAVGGAASQEGELRVAEVPQGELTPAGCAEFDLPHADRGYKFELRVALYHGGRLVNTNEWSLWALPDSAPLSTAAGAPGLFLRVEGARGAPIPEGASPVIADAVDEALAAYIERGGKCVLFTQGAVIENTILYYGSTSFYPIFRTIPWNAGNSGNSGTVIAPHPALAAFPHQNMCDLQFVRMFVGYLPMEFSPLRQYGVEPIIRMIDHYATNRNNAHMLEFRIGAGAVLVTSLGVLPEAAAHIEVRHLLQCLVDYARDQRFAPTAQVPKKEFLRLFSPRLDGRGDDFGAATELLKM
ncbi:MAG TPA: glycoside hydrolase family 2 TIM barrel-domain containing protein [Armatimonadota bacterium]|nr:glycoside hydrolase family 2 TIM barrel-domain containing protein [Armatimonadota bacterium]